MYTWYYPDDWSALVLPFTLTPKAETWGSLCKLRNKTRKNGQKKKKGFAMWRPYKDEMKIKTNIARLTFSVVI